MTHRFEGGRSATNLLGHCLCLQVAQVVAYELGIPVDFVAVKSTNSTMNANNFTTGGSVTSEECCKVM